jgi:hypothetical protein
MTKEAEARATLCLMQENSEALDSNPSRKVDMARTSIAVAAFPAHAHSEQRGSLWVLFLHKTPLGWHGTQED